MDKSEIRKWVKEKKRLLTKEQRSDYSSHIFHRLKEYGFLEDAPIVYCYVSYNEEVDTKHLLLYMLKEQIPVAVPKIKNGRMDFYCIESLEELQPGAYGILEPTTDYLIKGRQGLMILPGLAFDTYGNRIGYGGGFYDRYLEENKDVQYKKVALAYDFQVIAPMKAGEHDKKVDFIITEKRGIRMGYLEEIGARARVAAAQLNVLSQENKNRGLKAAAAALIENQEVIISANQADIEAAKANGMQQAMIDRLALDSERILKMSQGLEQIIFLDDPVNEVISMKQRPNGLQIGQKRVPLGVIGIIYESRPNVTADAFGLCFKTNNAVILRGGSDAIHSNTAIVEVIRKALYNEGLPADGIILIEDTSRETAKALMKLNKYIDVLIPRGGAGLIDTVVQNSTISVIETGTGNCHIYVDEFADYSMAISIIINAKTQRLGVCNACESLVIHEKSKDIIPLLYTALGERGVEIRGDERATDLCCSIVPGTEEDWGKEYLDTIISLKIVDSISEAIDHINKYSTKHSEAIITKDYANSLRFLNEIDSAAVYVNASTRFTDGYEFGFGAEIGISTQKLHARGPMGLLALTTTKYIIFGNGQVRP